MKQIYQYRIPEITIQVLKNSYSIATIPCTLEKKNKEKKHEDWV